MSAILIGREQFDEMLRHSREELPNEACGLMGGTGNAVKRLFRLRNMDASPVAYRLDPDEQLRAMRAMKEEGLELVGIYHSHPDSPPVPSHTDITRAFFPGTREPNFPDVVYFIVGVGSGMPEVRAYRITEHGVEKVEVRTA
jgi:proteasome lid subunit RPN8/RPN11